MSITEIAKKQAHNVSHFSKSRKLVFVCFWQGVFTVLLWVGKLDMATYSTLSIFTLGGYLAANVTQKSKLMDAKLVPPMGSGD